jgi:hypothetical protein
VIEEAPPSIASGFKGESGVRIIRREEKRSRRRVWGDGEEEEKRRGQFGQVGFISSEEFLFPLNSSYKTVDVAVSVNAFGED